MPPVDNRLRHDLRRSALIEPLESRIAPAWVGSIANGVLAIYHSGSGNGDFAVIHLKPGEPGTLVVENVPAPGTQYEFPLAGIVGITIAEPPTAQIPAPASDTISFDNSAGLIATADRPVTFLSGAARGYHYVSFVGGGNAGSWLPDPSSPRGQFDSTGGGEVVIGGGSYSYSKTSATFADFSSFAVLAPAGANSLTLDGFTGNSMKLDRFFASVSNLGQLSVDLSHGDAEAPADDVATITEVPDGTMGLQLSLGNGNDTVAVNRFLNSVIKGTGAVATISLGDGDDQLSVDDTQVFSGRIKPDGGAGLNTVNYTPFTHTEVSDAMIREMSGFSGAFLALDGKFQVVNILGTKVSQRFDLSGWTGRGSLASGGGTDTVIAHDDGASFVLSDTVLKRSDRGDFSLTGILNAELSGNGSSFDISGWTHSAALTSNAGDGTVIASNDGPFLLTDGGVWRGALPQVTFAGITNSKLTALKSGAIFDVTGWAGTGSLTAALADGSVTATNDADFTLGEDLLRRSGHGDLSLNGVHAAALTGGSSDNLFDLTGFYGSATIGGGSGTDTFRFTQAGDVVLTLTSPATATLTEGTTRIDLADVRHFVIGAAELTLTADAPPRAVVWTPVDGGTPSGSIKVSDDVGETQIDYAGGLAFSGLPSLTLLTPAGADQLTLDATNGVGTLSRGAAPLEPLVRLATFVNVPDVTFDLGAGDAAGTVNGLTVNSLGLAGLQHLAVKGGAGDDTLELTGALTDFGLAPNPGEGFSFDGGPGNDTLKATSKAGLYLTNSTLALGSTAPMTYSSVEHFVFGGGLDYTGTGAETFAWQPGCALKDVSTASFPDADISFTGNLGVHHVASLTVTTPAGADNGYIGGAPTDGILGVTTGGKVSHGARFSEVASIVFDFATNDGANAVGDRFFIDTAGAGGSLNLTILTGAGDDQLTVGHLVKNLGHVTFDAGAGHDTLEATGDVSMTLGDGLLSYSDNWKPTLDYGHIVLSGSAVEVANLTGGVGPNLFRFTGWSGQATVKGGDGKDTFDLSSGFSGTGSFQGEASDDTFILQSDLASTTTHAFGGATGSVSLDGGSGNDTMIAQANLDLTLTNQLFTRTIPKTRTTPAQSISNPLVSFEHAILAGGASANLLNARGFSGLADLTGEGGIDNLIASSRGGDLYGFHAGATASEMEPKLYTRDNFFASPGFSTDIIHATTKPDNILSFRYSHLAVTYSIPDAPGGSSEAGVRLAEGTITAVEGSIYDDHLTGNKKVNFLIGGKGNDTLKAVGFDYLYGGPGKDKFQGLTPFRFQDTNYPIPNSPGVPPV